MACTSNRTVRASLLMLILVGASSVWAQLNTSLTMVSTFDDNAFRNSLAQGDNITSVALGLEYQPEGSDLRLSYNGTGNVFRQYSERRYFSNSAGASYVKPFGSNEENAWTAGGSYYLRLNREQFNYYDFGQFVGSASVKYYLDSENGLLSRAGYRLRYRNYSNLSEFSYLENFGYASMSKFFETKTTAIIELAIGNKRYVSSTLTSATNSGTTGGDGGMMGEDGGMGGGGSRMSGDDMMGSLMNDNMVPSARMVSYGDPNTTQMIGTVRIAQSLSPSTGLSVQFLRRWDVSERTRFLSSGAVDFQGDEELWDDPYGYQSYEYEATVTQVFPWQISAQVDATYATKDYTRRIFLASDTDIPTGALRSDTRLVGSIDLRKSFDDGWLFLSGISLSMSYFYLKNSSNDSYYDFANNSVTFGVSTQF